MGEYVLIGAFVIEQPAAFFQILRRIPGRGNQYVGVRVAGLGVQTRHHLAGRRLEQVDLDAGFTFETERQFLAQIARAGGINGKCICLGNAQTEYQRHGKSRDYS